MGVDEPEAIAKVTAAFATKPAAAWLEDPGFAGGVGPSYEPVDLLADANVLARDGIVTIEGTGERVLAAPIRIDGPTGASSTAASPAPALGEHTDALLAEAGFDPAEVTALRDAAII